MSKRVYLSVPHMGESELRYVTEAFTSNWLSTVGPNLDAFEKSFTERVGLPCVALASGTAGMHLGLRLLGVGPGDEVICPSLTFIATINPAIYLGARPVFIDSDRASWNLDPNVLEDLLRKRAAAGRVPKALIVVHLYGQSADMDPIMAVCDRYGVAVLEDAAEAVGTTYKGRPAGTIAPIGVYSFNGNKIITTTGGGMMVAHDPERVQRARFWSQQARDPVVLLGDAARVVEPFTGEGIFYALKTGVLAAEAILASDSNDFALSALSGVYLFGTGWPQVTLITVALANPNAEVRAKAAERLGELGPAARPALPKLRGLRQDPEQAVRDAVELALPKIGE